MKKEDQEMFREDKYKAFRTGKVKDYYNFEGRECGQGYEDDQCVNCIWVMGLPLGMIACGKGLLNSKDKVLWLGKK